MRKIGLFVAPILLAIAMVACAGLGDMVSSGIAAVSETASIEICLLRLGDVEKAAEISDFFMNKAPVGQSSAWPERFAKLDFAYAQSVYSELHCKGPYAMPNRSVLPLTVYVSYYDAIKPHATEGEYPSFFEAFVAFAGEDGVKIMAKKDESDAKLQEMADKQGQIEDMKAVNKDKETSKDIKEKNKEEIKTLKDEIKVLKDEMKVQFDELIAMVDGLAGRTDLVDEPEKKELAQRLFDISSSISSLQNQAVLVAGITITQFVMAVPNAPAEMQMLVQRWMIEADPSIAASGTVQMDIGDIMRTGGDLVVNVKKLFKDGMKAPGRIGKLKVLLGSSSKFNSHMAKTMGTLANKSFSMPTFTAAKYTGAPQQAECINYNWGGR